MGTDKWLLRIGGQTVLERTVSILIDRVETLTIVLEHGGEETMKMPSSLMYRGDVSIIHDPVPNNGPLAGIAAGLANSDSEYHLIAAADMPFLSWRLAERLFKECERQRCSAIVPEAGGKLHPLFAVYHASTLESLTDYIAEGGRKVMEWLGRLGTIVLPEDEVWRLDPEGIALFNMNRPEDYEKAKEIAIATGCESRYDG
jgi:molybdenum cofactor guanylyltransferase